MVPAVVRLMQPACQFSKVLSLENTIVYSLINGDRAAKRYESAQNHVKMTNASFLCTYFRTVAPQTADTGGMTEGPYPNVPPTTGPVLGIPAMGAIGSEQRRQEQRRQRQASEPSADPVAATSPQGPPPPAPPDPLIEALDRLRATGEERSAEDAVLRLIRARRLYGDGGDVPPLPVPPAVD